MNIPEKMFYLDIIAILLFLAFCTWASKQKRLWSVLNYDFIRGIKTAVLKLLKSTNAKSDE